MKAMTVRLTRVKKAALFGAFLLACAALLWFPAAAATGARRGLSVCGDVLIPSLFPFMALSSFLVESGLSDVVGRRLEGITRRLFGLPGRAAAGILLSFVGGYPAGAAACEKLLLRGDLTLDEARRMMRFCVVSGPAFVVSTVGTELLGSTFHGWLLLAAQWAAALCIGMVGGGGRQSRRNEPPQKREKIAALPAVGVAVGEAARAMLLMCGFVTAATCFLSVLDAMGLPPKIVDAVAAATEVSVGCIAWAPRGVVLSLCIGFGGLSVHGQIAALFAGKPVITRGFFAARIAQGMIAAGVTALLFCFFPLPLAAFAPHEAKILPLSGSFTGTLALLATVATALLSFPQKAK